MAASADEVFAAGAAALEAGDFRAAGRLFQQIADAYPRAHAAWNALAVVAVRAGLPDVAAAHAQRALDLDRRNPVYLNNLGVALGELGRFDESEQAFRRALKAKPAYAEGQFNLGKVLHKLGKMDEALRAFERAYAMDANFPGLRASLCQMYRKHGRAERAFAVLKEDPAGLADGDLAEFAADVIAELEGADRAIEWLKQVTARRPGWRGGQFSLALLLLARGRWREGWQHYLWRGNALADRSDPPAPLPARLDGQSVQLRSEQGMGDMLFFLRFAAELVARGASVTAAVPRRLAAVVRDAERFRVLVEDEPAAQSPADRVLWMGDLPALVESAKAPGAFPLARDEAAAARWRQRLAGLGPAPYLAVTWRAGTDVLRQQEFGRPRAFLLKEVPPAELGAALRGWRGTLVSVQREALPGEADAFARAAGAAVHDLSQANQDLPEILALLSVTEEYVCVSNTNVHLLAGIGRHARVLVPYPPEWRWMREGASPWFPGCAVYREPQQRGWTAPLAALRRDLIG